MTQLTLWDIAHARAGDKGDNSIILVAPYEQANLASVAAALDAEAVAAHFGLTPDAVTVTVHQALCAATVVLRGRLQGGVTRSLTIDPHGKTLAAHLLELPLARP
ncbi:MAG TPA: hypothetical protein VLS51_10195 [Propionibacteriaceae bacterium]|nr:hypothetical protein [Propionibacteriaceae bacterium]